MKKILIISPNYRPMSNGLGHYSTIFHHELSKFSECFVLTSLENEKNERTFPIVKKWKFIELFLLFKKFNLYNFDEFLVQYVPFMYKKRGGINFSFCFFMMYLGLVKKKKINIMVHEIYYPYLGDLKSFVLNLCHRIMMKMLNISSRKIFVSNFNFYKILQSEFKILKERLYILPVFSNLPVIPIKKDKGTREPVLIGMFGSTHPSKETTNILKILLDFFKQGKKIKLNYIGETREIVLKDFSDEDKKIFDKFCIFLGHLDGTQVVSEISKLDYLLCYFIDGLSARRSSAIAALSLGVPIISTMGENTDSFLIGQSFIRLFPKDLLLFKDELIKLLDKKDHLCNEKVIIKFYNSHFSKEMVAKQYIENS